MKVLLLHQNRFGRPWGGIESYCKKLQKLFDNDNNIEISLSQLYPHVVTFGRLAYDPIDLTALISNSNADIVHINGYTSIAVKQGIEIASQLGKKVVLSPHWHPFDKMNSPLLARIFWTFYIKPYLNKVDGILCINNEDTSFFSKIHSNTIAIPHWINSDIYIGEKKDIKKKNSILFVGRSDDKNKGFDHLLALPTNKYEIHCVAKAKEVSRNDIIFHEHVSQNELNRLYREASLVVIPSRYEAFSYVALEAICAGCPIVVTKGVRFTDYILDQNIIGSFAFGDYAGFIQKVDEYITRRFNPENYIGKFKESNIKQEYKKFYNNILNGKQ